MGVKAGDILASSEPFAYVLCNSERAIRCDTCLQRNEELKKCKGCSFAYYCDKNCQKLSWKDHGQECSNLRKVHPRIPTDFARLYARIILKLQRKDVGKTEKTLTGDVRSFDDLMSHKEAIKKDENRINQLIAFGQVLEGFIGIDKLPHPETMLEIFSKIVINTFSITDEEMKAIGIGLYIGASVLDHSCEPNAIALFNGPKLNVRAICDLPSISAKVNISYIDVLIPTCERRAQLLEQYYFECNCERCQDLELDSLMTSICCVNENCEEPVLIENDVDETCKKCKANAKISQRKPLAKKIMASSAEILSSFKELKKNDNYVQILSESEMQIRQLEGLLHNLNLFHLRLLVEAFEAAFELQHWEKTVIFGSRILPGYRKYYGKNQVHLGIHLMKLGKIHLYLGQMRKGLSLFLEAEPILRVTHSAKHQLYGSLREMMNQCTESE